MAVDTFFAGTLKGFGKVYIQTVLDCFSRYVWARLYTSKMPVTAVQILNNHVLPFFEEQGVRIWTILSDNGREYAAGRTSTPTSSSCSSKTYNQRRPPPRPRHGGTDALRGLQGRDPPKANPQALSQEGGEESSVGLDLGEAGCQAITVLVQLEILAAHQFVDRAP